MKITITRFQLCLLLILLVLSLWDLREKNDSIAAEHLTGWPIALATSRHTSDMVVDFVMDESVYSFWPPRAIFSDSGRCFIARTVQSFMVEHSIN